MTSPLVTSASLQDLERRAEEQLKQAGEALSRANAREAQLAQVGVNEESLKRNFVRWIAIATLLALLLGMLATYFWHRQWLEKHAYYPKQLVVRDRGVKYIFEYDGTWEQNSEGSTILLPFYQCSRCKKKNIPGLKSELEQHAARCPSGKVTEVVDPSLTA